MLETIVQENTRFSIGDTVRCIGESIGKDGNLTYGGAGWELDLVFKIESKNSIDEVYWRGKNNNGVWGHHLELLTLDKLLTKVKLFSIGDIVICTKVVCLDNFTGEGQIVYNDGIFYHIRKLDTSSGGGILLENRQYCWKFNLIYTENLKKVGHTKIEIGIDKNIKKIFKLNDEVFVKNMNTIGKIESIIYNNGIPQYALKIYPDNRYINIKSSEIKKATNKVKAKVCYQCLVKKLTRDVLGDEEENEKIKPGSVIQVRNLEVCEKNSWIIGKKYITVHSEYDKSLEYCTISKNTLPNICTIRREHFKLVEDLSNKFTLKVSSLVVKVFNQYRGDKSPILLLGKNKKGVIDVVFTATDESGCDNLAGMPPEIFAHTLRNIILTKREWVGYGIIYHGSSKPSYFTSMGLEFIEKDMNLNRFYVCILPGRGIYPYRLIKCDGRIQLLPVQIEIVN